MVERRRLLEVLKWVPPEDILCHAATVSRLWLESSGNEEVWASLCSDLDVDLYEDQSFKEAFRRGKAPILPILTKRSLAMFNCRSETVVSKLKFQGKLPISFGSAAVFLQVEGLLLCGGYSTDRVYYAASSGFIRRIQDMRAIRYFHSTILLRETIYVFGGGDLATRRTAEKLQIERLNRTPNREWRALPDSLVPHYGCQPCAHSALLYLCGGGSGSSEVFDTIQEVYTLLPFTLPENAHECASFFCKGELVIFTRSYVSRWRHGTMIKSKHNIEYWKGCGKTKSILLGNSLFTSDFRGYVNVFDSIIVRNVGMLKPLE